MHVLAVIAGLLLLIFGAGWTVWAIFSDGQFASLESLPWALMFVAIFGGVPAFAGWKLFRYGMSFNQPRDHGQAKADREKEE
jgi:hypothetical protein